MCRWLEEQERYLKKMEKRQRQDEKRARDKALLQRAADRAKKAKAQLKRDREQALVEQVEKKIEMDFIAANYPSRKFYNTPEWKQLRYRALRLIGNVCMLCGASPKTGAVIHVDHILPRSIYPERAMDIDNLQILCETCNLGKLNRDATDFRK